MADRSRQAGKPTLRSLALRAVRVSAALRVVNLEGTTAGMNAGEDDAHSTSVAMRVLRRRDVISVTLEKCARFLPSRLPDSKCRWKRCGANGPKPRFHPNFFSIRGEILQRNSREEKKGGGTALGAVG